MLVPFSKVLALCGMISLLSACIGSEEPSDGSSDNQSKQPIAADSAVALRSVESETCPSGAVEVQLGMDTNANGRLDPDEIDHTRTFTVCHGANGVDGVAGLNGQDGQSSLIRVVDATEEACPFGGKTVLVGTDDDRDGVLAEAEVDQRESICNLSAPVYTALVSTDSEPAGEHCAAGGIVVRSGLDIDANGVLEEAEVQNTDYVCHGVDGTPADLSELLIETVSEPWGENCFHGGEKHQIGLDENGNNLLEPSEIISASYSCVLNEAPSIEHQSQDAVVGQVFNLDVFAFDYMDDTVELTVTDKPDWLSIQTLSADHLQLSGTVPNGVGATYSVGVSATDTDAVRTSIINIVAVDGILIFSSADSVVEGNEGSQTAAFTVSLSKAPTEPLRVYYTLARSRSLAGSNWQAANIEGRIEFAPGELTQTISVEIFGDTQVELAESIRLDIRDFDYAGTDEVYLPAPAYLDIVNDDGLELVFGSEQENAIALLVTRGYAHIELLSEIPDWLSLSQNSVFVDTPPYDSATQYVLAGSPSTDVIGATGSIELELQTERGRTAHTLTYRVIEGDTDQDGVPNSEDAFPTNPAAHSDTDSDGLGDEWEIAIFESLDTANATTDFDNNGVTDLSAFENNTPVHDLTFSFENGELPNGWVNTGDVDWVVTDASSYHGAYALTTAQPLNPGQVARLEFTFSTQQGLLNVRGRLAEGEGYFNSWNLRLVSGSGSSSGFYLSDDYWNTLTRNFEPGEHRLVLEYRNSSDTHTGRQVYIDYFSGLSGIIPADRDGDGVLNGEDLFPDNPAAATDTDEDGIGDEWELSYFGTLDRVNANSDFDQDGLSDVSEFTQGANPNNSDTDNDGVTDGEDLWVTDSRYARDTDNDGLADEWELTHFASLQETDGSQDSDGDSISDADEFAQGSTPAPDRDNDGVSDSRDAFPDNPQYAFDRDNDGLADEWERLYCTATGNDTWYCENYPQDTLHSLTANGDFDQDGRSDLQEFMAGTNPTVVDLTAIEDVVAVSAGQSITFNPTENDTSAAVAISVSQIALPQTGEGSLQDNSDGTYTYTAPANFIGWIMLDYTADDGITTDSSRVLIRVSDQQFGQLIKIKGNEGYTSEGFTMALFDDGLLYAWGNNDQGQLGNGDTTDRHSPVRVTALADVTAFDMGYNFSVALKQDGTVWYWGGNNVTTTPQQIDSLTDVKGVAAGYSELHIITASGNVASAYASSSIPSSFGAISGMANIKSLAAGQYHLLALDEDGVVWSEGENGSGELGNGTNTASYDTAVQVSKLSGIETIEATAYQSFAIDSDGALHAWGNNSSGRLGDGTHTNRNVPVEITSLTNVASVAAGRSHTLVLTDAGQVYGMGNGQGFYSSTPTLLVNEGIAHIGAGAGNSFVVTNEGVTQSMGANNQGQLGNGYTNSTSEFGRIDWLHAGQESMLSELWGEGFEWGELPPLWSNAGQHWVISQEASQGDYSLTVTTSLGDYESALLGVNATTAAGEVTFAVKTSTEADYDVLIFLIDGVEQARFSGENDWATTQVFTVEAGRHSFEWNYVKDGGTSAGADTVWIDDIRLPIDTDGDGLLDVEDPEPNVPAL